MNGKDVSFRAMPGTTARSLPADWKPYVYRGTGEDVLTPGLRSGPRPKRKPQLEAEPELRPEPEAEPDPEPVMTPEETRLQELEEQLTERGVVKPAHQAAAEPEPEPAVKPARRCRRCKYLTTSDSHRVICGSGSGS